MRKEFITEFFKPHRSIPRTPWSASGRWDLSPSNVSVLTIGLFIFGLGDGLVIQSNIGNGPWSVLAQGVAQKLQTSIGWSTFGISLLVLLLWIPLKEKPGFGTLLNVIVIAIAIQIAVMIFPLQHNFFSGLLFVFLGIALIGFGSSLYITCHLGTGPRDGLMTGLHSLTGVRVGRVRLAIETTVFLIGALLGGRVGLGTALFALLVGQSVAIFLGVVARFTAK